MNKTTTYSVFGYKSIKHTKHLKLLVKRLCEWFFLIKDYH